MPVFRFKHFAVSNSRSAMKVNTDGVLLGALMTVTGRESHLLDVGTGTGSVALMAAQRLSVALYGTDGLFPETASASSPDPGISIEAIDIDQASADEASENFSCSPWCGSMTACHQSLASFEDSLRVTRPSVRYDLVFSNPPYFESSLKAPDPRRRTARHADTLSYRDLVSFAAEWLSDSGRLSMILPADLEREVRRYAVSMGMYPLRLVRIRTSPRRPCSRIVMEFSREGTSFCLPGGAMEAGPGHAPSESVLTIMEEGTYSSEYRSLVSDFLFV